MATKKGVFTENQGKRPPQIFQAIQYACEYRLDRNAGGEVVTDETGVYRLPLRLMIPCLDRLLKSAHTWHKRDGQRGYLGFVGQYV